MPDPNNVIKNETGAQTLLGYVVTIKNGVATCHLDIGPQHGNRHDALHGGIMSCLLDNVMGYMAALHINADAAPRVMTISMTTQYLAPAKTGRVTATGRVTGGGRKLLFTEGTLEDEQGRALATATGVYKRIRE